MKFLSSQIAYFLQGRSTHRNIKLLVSFLFLLVFIVTVYSLLFHAIMLLENRDYSIVTGFYWTLTVMSTLGFGDITFTTDLGRIFSIIVLLSGIVLLLVVLPFSFIQFFYAPWLEVQSRARAPRELPAKTTGHVILTHFDPITEQLVEKLKHYKYEYVILVDDPARAIELYDRNFRVVVGNSDDPRTYERLRVHKAALLVATGDDMVNTNIAFTVRELNRSLHIVTNADSQDSVDILNLAGSTHTLQFMQMLGQSLARRTLGVNTGANIIGSFDGLMIAEAPAMRTPLEGLTLIESRLRETTGINVVGIWKRGHFEMPHPSTRITASTVLVLAGSKAQLQAYEKKIGFYHSTQEPVLILGGGRVGRAAATTLKQRGIEYRIVEKNSKLAEQSASFVHGSAADIHTLERAGIHTSPSVIITTHNDALNIYLTIYCRRLRSDIQIISRATLERNISKLHKAGADLVMSYASMGANTIMNILKPNDILMLAEGLNIFRMPVHRRLASHTLAQSNLRKQTGCSVIAINTADKALLINPDPTRPLHEADELILIGSDEAEADFIKYYEGL